MASATSASRTGAGPANPRGRPPPTVTVTDGYTHFTACDACRKRKKKCDGRATGCGHCEANKLECIYRPKKSRPLQSSSAEVGPTKVDSLLGRIDRLERVFLRHPNLLQDPQHYGDLEALYESFDQSQGSPEEDRADEEEAEYEQDEEVQEGGDAEPEFDYPMSPQRAFSNLDVEEELARTMRTLTIENADALWDSPDKDRRKPSLSPEPEPQEESRVFIGASSPFAFISHAGMKWIHEQLGNTGFTVILDRSRRAFTDRMFFPEDLEEEVGNLYDDGGRPRSDPGLNNTYIQEYFTNVNPWMPIFDENDFIKELSRKPDGHTHPAWAMATYAVHALGAQSLAYQKAVPNNECSDAWAYIRCACRYVSPMLLCSRRPGIVAVQALLGMVLFLLETDGMVPMATLLGLAASIGGYTGFHRDGLKLDSGMNKHKAEVYRNVFWICFILDKDIALRSGRPMNITDKDIQVPLPSVSSASTPNENHGPRSWQRGYLRDRAKTALVACTVLQLLYSCENAAMPPLFTRHLTENLSEQLEERKRKCPWTRYSIEELVEKATAEGTPLKWAWWANVIRVRWSYFTCLISIYRLPFDLVSPPPPRSGILRPGPSGSVRVVDFARAETYSIFKLFHSRLMPQPPRTLLLEFLATQFILFITVLRKYSPRAGPPLERQIGKNFILSDEEMMIGMGYYIGNNDCWGGETLRFRKLVLELTRGMWNLADTFIAGEMGGRLQWRDPVMVIQGDYSNKLR